MTDINKIDELVEKVCNLMEGKNLYVCSAAIWMVLGVIVKNQLKTAPHKDVLLISQECFRSLEQVIVGEIE